jgi:hypothetical protein
MGEAHRCLADACTLAERSGVDPIVGDIPVESVLREVDELLNQDGARGVGTPEAAHVA